MEKMMMKKKGYRKTTGTKYEKEKKRSIKKRYKKYGS
jgi:hypothetical protein